jgi:hypothetical protein
MLFLCSKTVDNTTELGAKICGAELGATSTPRRPGCANAAVPRRHNLWRRAVLPRRHRLWRRVKGPKMHLKFSKVQTGIFFRKIAKIQKIRPRRRSPGPRRGSLAPRRAPRAGPARCKGGASRAPVSVDLCRLPPDTHRASTPRESIHTRMCPPRHKAPATHAHHAN